MDIAQIIKTLAKGDAPLSCMVATVTAVDKNARTIDCEPINEEAPLLGVNLQANQNSAVGVVQFPRVGSFVVVGFLADGAAGAVLVCEDVEEVQVVVTDPDTASLIINEKGVAMNGGSLGGLVKVEDVTKRFNLLEKDINKLKDTLAKWTPTPNDGGAALKTAASGWFGSKLTETKRGDYENEKVKQ